MEENSGYMEGVEQQEGDTKKAKRLGPSLLAKKVRKACDSINNLQAIAAEMGGQIRLGVEQENGRDKLVISGVDFSL